MNSNLTPDSNNNLVKTGIIGSVLTAICCFTPVLVILLGSLGLSAWAGWLDVILLPALALFIALTGYALFSKFNRGTGNATGYKND